MVIRLFTDNCAPARAVRGCIAAQARQLADLQQQFADLREMATSLRRSPEDPTR